MDKSGKNYRGENGNDNGEYMGLLNGTREVHAVLRRWRELHHMLPNLSSLPVSPRANTDHLCRNTVDHQ